MRHGVENPHVMRIRLDIVGTLQIEIEIGIAIGIEKK
jgi:hypothetical protein